MDINERRGKAQAIRKARFSYIWCRIFGHWFTIWIPSRSAVCKRCLKSVTFVG